MVLTPEHSRVVAASRAHLDLGFRYEQGGALERALESYRDALVSSIGPEEQIEARLRIARVLRSMSAWERSRLESAEAIRLPDEIGADDLAAEAMNVEVGALQIRGSFDGADELLHAAIARARSPRVSGITLQNLGRGAAERGDFATADRYSASPSLNSGSRNTRSVSPLGSRTVRRPRSTKATSNVR